jgi:hypothetical protein
MSDDIGPILDSWGYASGELQVRAVDDRDGRRKIQMRMDLGLMQLEWTGRPDGRRPFDFVSLLDYHQARRYKPRAGRGAFLLSREECWALNQEATQYYWRRLSFFELREYERAEQDAVHNLEILDLCQECAAHEDDRRMSEQYRVFVMAHRAQARALALLERQEHELALAEIRSGIREITGLLEQRGDLGKVADCAELRFLEEWELEVDTNRPLSPREKLSADLRSAVAQEQFELAASLRDRLRMLEAGQVHDPRDS